MTKGSVENDKTTTTSASRNLFNIPLGEPFFDILVDHLLSGNLIPSIHPTCDPLLLADTTIFVPTRRAARALAQVFGEKLGPKPAILPRIVPLGDPSDIEERAVLMEEPVAASADLPDAIPPLRRQLYLMQLIEAWRKAIRQTLLQSQGRRGPLLKSRDLFQVASSPADALALAGDLAALMDEMIIENVGWEQLQGLAPEHDEYWSITTEFLKIAGDAWPAYLRETGLMDATARRDALLRAEAERLLRERPLAPVIVAGSTGSQPATAELMKAIASLPNGAVVLPGLDQDLDQTSWDSIQISGADMALGLSSPQALLKRLVETRMGVTRRDVKNLLAAVMPVADDRAARRHLLSEVLRPAETTEKWAETRDATLNAKIETAFAGISLIETADEREEALAIALRLREALENVETQAALVTPDRALARRVSAELKRFGLNVEDSAGQPLASELRGSLARLLLDAALGNFEPLAVMALLNHPLVTLEKPRTEIELATTMLDICVLRDGHIESSLYHLQQAAAAASGEPSDRHAPAPKKRLKAEMGSLCLDLVGWLQDALTPFAAIFTGAGKSGSVSIFAIAEAHRQALENLTLDAESQSHWHEEEDGEALAQIFDELGTTYPASSDPFGFDAHLVYPALFESLLAAKAVRSRKPAHPRLKIWGPLEARLLEVDLVILGGLNEGSWPPVVSTDAFLNRPMRAAIGLSPPERRIGQSAHDFAMLMGMKEVVISRSGRVGGEPAIASRFLRRLEAYAGETIWKAAVLRGHPYVQLARHLDDLPEGERPKPAPRPEPRPPVELRPVRLSITEIERLYRDPYAIFAQHILKLAPLDERLAPPDASDKGTIIHEVLAKFVETFPGDMPDNAIDKLMVIGEESFAPYRVHLEVEAFWWPRFKVMAQWFIGWETARRAGGIKSIVETYGKLEFPLSDGSIFTLSGTADRIDLLSDGTFAIIDYKTGVPPGPKEVLRGLNPQMTLEAAMVRAGAFPGLAKERSVGELLYVKPPSKAGMKEKTTYIKPEGRKLDELCADHLKQLSEHLDRYRSPQKGYRSRRFPKKKNYTNVFDHLARVREWGDQGVEDDEA